MNETQETTARGARNLIRRTDNKVLGGVCSGLGAYFGVDPLLFRIGFVVLGLLSFLGVFAYLLVWGLIRDEYGRRGNAVVFIVGGMLLVPLIAMLLPIFMMHVPYGPSFKFVIAVLLVGAGVLLLSRWEFSKPPADPAGAGGTPAAPAEQAAVPPAERPAGIPERTRALRTARERSALPAFAGRDFARGRRCRSARRSGRGGPGCRPGRNHVAAHRGSGPDGRSVVRARPRPHRSRNLAAASGPGRQPRQHAAQRRRRQPVGAALATRDLENVDLLAGELDLDLSRYRFPGRRTELDVRIGAGRVSVHVPEDVNVESQFEIRAGEVHGLRSYDRGLDISFDETDGDPLAARRLVLNVVGGIATIDLHRFDTARRRPDGLDERREKRRERLDRRDRAGNRTSHRGDDR